MSDALTIEAVNEAARNAPSMPDHEPDRSLAAYALNLLHGATLEPFEVEHLTTIAAAAGAKIGEEHLKLAAARDLKQALMRAKLQERDDLREALAKCRDQFRRYEHLHALKPDGAGREKAKVNGEFADMCQRVMERT